jgi:hypothetical protein
MNVLTRVVAQFKIHLREVDLNVKLRKMLDGGYLILRLCHPALLLSVK